MGSLYGSDLDTLQPDFFKEVAFLRGTQVIFQTVDTITKDIYTDVEVVSLTDSDNAVDVIFQQYPQNRKTLQKLGWYNKDSDDNPSIAFVSMDLPSLQRWQRVLLPGVITGDSVGSGWRAYQITKIGTTMDHPHFYTIALAPIFTSVAPVIDRAKNTNFIDLTKIEEV